jgi:glyoxylase-like metal-dependent hydrolase (beta-lactamase superfamily II)
MCEEIIDGLYRITARKPGSHSYLIKGEDLCVLIDPGVRQHVDALQRGMSNAGVSVRDVDLVICTHEHFDHIGANKHFQDTAMISAHRYAATKLACGDEEITMCRANAQDVNGYRVHMWLENISLIDAGDWKLKILHTPGHTSGCICIYEPRKRVLISGDTVFAKGTISDISKSGSYGEYINSLRRLNTMKIDLILPGHGAVSDGPEEDMDRAIEAAEEMLRQFE